MDKKTMYLAVFAVAIVVLFIIEPFAIGIIQSAGKVDTGGSGGNGNATAQSFTGTAYANVTFVRYEPYVLVAGNSSAVEAVKDRLLADGIATYAVWSGNSLVVSLKSSKDVPSVASMFESANASALATAYLSTSDKVTVVGTDGTSVVADGNSISMQIRPIYEEGSTHEASFAARVDSGAITGMGTLSITPTSIKGAMAVATLSSSPQATYSVWVDFKDRAAAKQYALAANATYKERSFIYIPNATKETLDAAIAGMPYATGAQPGIISVSNEFNDSEAAGAALFKLGFAPTFPQSIAAFGSNASNGSAQALAAILASHNITASVSSDWTATILLPATLEKAGKTYLGPSEGIELVLEGTGTPANATSMNVSVDFEAVGSKITRVTAVNPV